MASYTTQAIEGRVRAHPPELLVGKKKSKSVRVKLLLVGGTQPPVNTVLDRKCSRDRGSVPLANFRVTLRSLSGGKPERKT